MRPCRICHSDRIPCECWYVNPFGCKENKQLFEKIKKLMKEGAMESNIVTIEHPQHGIVERVQEIDPPRKEKGWCKIIDAVECFYYESRGWRVKIKSKVDVTEEVELEKDDYGRPIFWLNKKDAYMSPDITFTKAQAVVLPEGMNWRDWLNKHYLNSPDNLVSVLLIHTTTVIQVLKEGD